MDGNCTNTSTNGSVIGAELVLWLVISVIYATILVFPAIVLPLVVAAKDVHGTIRFVLANILIASISTVVGIALIGLCALFISMNSHLFTHSDVSFQIFLSVMAMGENGRSAFMAVFAVVVVVIIKCSSSAVKFKYLAIAVVAVRVDCVCGSWYDSCCP